MDVTTVSAHSLNIILTFTVWAFMVGVTVGRILGAALRAAKRYGR